MTAQPREELISAYVDGELSDDQRAEVEQWLAENSQLRRLHAELLALRAQVQSLERHELDHDISDAVLRRAEQSVLRGGEPTIAGGTVSNAAGRNAWWRRGGSWRRVVWPAIAVAAALAILVYDATQREPEREVARAPARDEYAVEPQSGSEVATPEKDELRLAPQAGRELDERDPPALNVAPDSDADFFESRKAERLGRLGSTRAAESMRRKLAKPDAPRSEAAPGAAGLQDELDAAVAVPQAANGLVLECSPEYLREGTFEQLLDRNKIPWRRVAQNETARQQAKSGELADRAESLEYRTRQPSVRVTYVVDGTAKQIDAVVAEAGDRVLRRGYLPAQSALAQAPRDRRQPLQAGARYAEGKAVGFTITLIAPAAASPASEPAASQPAAKSP